VRAVACLLVGSVLTAGCGKPVHIRSLPDEGFGRKCIAYIDAFAAEKINSDPYKAALVMVPAEIEKLGLCEEGVVIPSESLGWFQGFGSFAVDVYCQSGERCTTLKPGEEPLPRVLCHSTGTAGDASCPE
jgi:hypothetical protein